MDESIYNDYRYAYVQMFQSPSVATDVLERFVGKLLGNEDYEQGRIFVGQEDSMVYLTVAKDSQTYCEAKQRPGELPELVFLDAPE